MTENKRFELKLCSNGTYYVYENGTLTDIDFDKFNKESADALIDEVNALYDENEQLKIRCGDGEQIIRNLKKENKQLKSSNMEYEDALARLEEKNEKLTNELKNLRRLTNELYMEGSE